MDDSSEHEKAKDVNNNVVETISHRKYKNTLLSKKYLRHSMNKFKVKIIEQELFKSNLMKFVLP